jgi:hypothetical protein
LGQLHHRQPTFRRDPDRSVAARRGRPHELEKGGAIGNHAAVEVAQPEFLAIVARATSAGHGEAGPGSAPWRRRISRCA